MPSQLTRSFQLWWMLDTFEFVFPSSCSSARCSGSIAVLASLPFSYES